MSLPLSPLTLNDRLRFESALKATKAIGESPLAMLAWAPHLVWSHLFTYSWAEVQGWLCVFAEYPDGVYMPLPPLSAFDQGSSTSKAVSSYNRVLGVVFEDMMNKNKGRGVTRIENIPEEFKHEFAPYGYCVRGKGFGLSVSHPGPGRTERRPV